VSRYPIKSSEFSSHSMILDLLGEGHSRTLLDVGSADGQMAISFVNRGWDVTGIEPVLEDAILTTERGVSVLNMGFEEAVIHLDEKFDAIVLADVLEHFSDPWRQLSSVAKLCHPESRVIISIPNVAHLVPRVKLVFGKFDYEDRGIMDRTHLRFFTRKTVLELISQSGLECESFQFTSTPIELVFPKITSSTWGQALLAANSKLSKVFPTLLGYQFLAVCRMPRITD